MTRTKLSVSDLRLGLAIRLAVAPRHLFHSLWQPKQPAHLRDNARKSLVAFITEGWDAMEIEATEPEIVAHSVPPSKGAGGEAQATEEG